jgi:hypothetical protein
MILRDPNYAAPGTPATPTSPTSPTGPGMGMGTGTGTGTGTGYNWADMLGGMLGGGGGGRRAGLSTNHMSIPLSNDAIWNANLQRVKNSGQYQTFLDTLLTSPDAYLERGARPGNDVGYMRDLAASELNIDGRIANEADTYKRIADAWRIRKQQDADKAIADEAAKRARETASTTGITLPFPA